MDQSGQLQPNLKLVMPIRKYGSSSRDLQGSGCVLGLRINLDRFTSILLDLGITVEDSAIKVKNARDGKVRAIDINNEQDRQSFFESIVGHVERYFSLSREKSDEKEHRVGFN